MVSVQFAFREKTFLQQVFLQRLICQANASIVEKQSSRHTSTIAFLHSNPILKRTTNQRLRRYRRDGIVEIADFHRSKRHFLHDSICIGRSYRYPISLVKHLVAGKSNTCHKSFYRIFEYQHQDSGCCTQSRKERHRILVDDDGNDDDSGNEHHDDFQHATKRVEILLC